jgi:hypothetical protein
MPHSAASARSVTRAPHLRWARVFIAALALLLFSIGGLEAHWRRQGFRPTVPDSLTLWYFWRQQVYRDDGKVIVFLGTSRAAADISLATMRECLPRHQIVQLGLVGAESCVGILQDLANDPDFHGTVICELDTPLLERSRWNGHPEFRTYRPTMNSLIEGVIYAWLQDRIVCLSAPCTLRALIAKSLDFKSTDERLPKSRRTFLREMCFDFGALREAPSKSFCPSHHFGMARF